MDLGEERQIKVTFDNGEVVTCYPGTLVKNIIKKHKAYNPEHNYVAALLNNRVVTLTYPLNNDSELKMLSIADSHGWRVYRNSVSFLLAKAAAKCYPNNNLEIKHSLGEGFYCSFEGIDKKELPEILEKIEICMRKDVEAKHPINRHKIQFKEALDYFTEKGREDKCNILRFQNQPKIAIYHCDGFIDLAHGALVDNTKDLPYFKLIPYESGFVLQFPDKGLPIKFSEFKKQKPLFNIFKAYKKWGNMIGIRTVGDLNDLIIKGEFRRIIEIEEAFQEKRLAEIADDVNSRKKDLKWVLIAGPSSSGKTTFAHSLSTQLMVNGIKPVILSVDNYFVERDKTPRDANGHYDFENLETIDLALLYDHLEKLDKGEEIEMPTFDFIEGKKKYLGNKIKLKENEMAVIEGIHSLNAAMTKVLPAERKYKIYINCLTQLNLDNNHRISTTDCRLIRRTIRDHRTRGYRALATFQTWHSVRDGEKKWIFPYQGLADTAFSSALNYELFVLKPLVEPLFAEIKPWHEPYPDARRIQEFLENFVSAPSIDIPRRSLIREFIGGGILG